MNTQGKNKRRQLEAFDSVHNVTLSVDSQEEVDFLDWLCEAHQLSAVSDFQYQPPSFRLFENTKYVDVEGKTRTLFQEHKYSCDFMVTFDANAQKELAKEFKVRQEQLSEEISAYVDTKGLFNRNARSFSTDRKWVWEKFGIYVLEVIPAKFFAKFGCPFAAFRSKKTGKPRKLFLGMKFISEKLRLKP